MSIDGNEIIASVIALLIYLFAKEAREWFAEWRKANGDKAWTIDKDIEDAVRYAEQTGRLKGGQAKLSEAVGFAQELLNSKGIKVDLSHIIGLTEAKVNALYGKQPTPPTWTTGGGQS